MTLHTRDEYQNLMNRPKLCHFHVYELGTSLDLYPIGINDKGDVIK